MSVVGIAVYAEFFNGILEGEASFRELSALPRHIHDVAGGLGI